MLRSAKASVFSTRGSALILSAAVLLTPHVPAFGQELPRVLLDTTYAPPPVPPGRLISVPDGGDFQAALDSAQPGDIIELQAGSTFTGSFVLPAKAGTGWIYIRSSAHQGLPAPGTRVSPSQSGLMPKVVTATTEPAIRTTFRADLSVASHHYRFVGVEVTTSSSTLSNLIWLEYAVGGASQQNAANQAPTDIVFDRCYIHGNATGNIRRGIALNSARTAVIDSYLSDFHEVGADAQALAGWNGPGPFKVVNDYLEGSGENMIFGGADPAIPGLVPADIEVRRNHFFKPLTWKQDDPRYAGHPWSVKNIFELKNARRVLAEGNVLENNWVQSQVGIAVLFTTRNQDGNCRWCVVEDVTFQKNILRHTAGAFNVSGTDDNFPSGQAARILIRDNLLYDIGPAGFGGTCCSRIFQLLNVDSPDPGQAGGIRDLIIDHNTGRIQDLGTSAVSMGDSMATDDKHQSPVFRNNLLQRGTYGVFGSAVGEGTAALDQYAAAWTLSKNVIIGAPPSIYPPQDCSPAATCFPATDDGVGFVDSSHDDYRLCDSTIPGCTGASPYKNAGTDGKDIGADMDAVAAATAGVVSGSPGPAPFTGTPFPVPGRFEAEDFDLGGEGVAYHDAVAGNAGGLYRTGEDVDIIAAKGNASGYVVNNIETGEWLEYTVNVAAAGTYDIQLKVSSEFGTSRFHVEIDGMDVTGSVLVPDTGWWGAFQLVGTSGVSLSAGPHVLRIYSEQQYFNLDAIQIS
jgi:hypothetical protein